MILLMEDLEGGGVQDCVCGFEKRRLDERNGRAQRGGKTESKTCSQTDRQDKTRQDKTRQDKTRQDKTGKTRQDKTRQDKTCSQIDRQDKTSQTDRYAVSQSDRQTDRHAVRLTDGRDRQDRQDRQTHRQECRHMQSKKQRNRRKTGRILVDKREGSKEGGKRERKGRQAKIHKSRSMIYNKVLGHCSKIGAHLKNNSCGKGDVAVSGYGAYVEGMVQISPAALSL
eukprot:767773-Hanusia_phi.AAC.4